MKKVFSLLLVLMFSVTLIGCEDKEESDTKKDNDKVVEKEEKVYTLEVGKIYGDKNNLYNGGSLTTLNLGEDGSVTYSNCGKEAGCNELRGTYKIDESKLIVTLNQRWDYGEWTKLEEVSINEYTITDDNTFVLDDAIFVIQEVVKEEPTLVIGKTYKWESNGDGTTIIFNKNGTVESSAWGKNAGSTKYKGTYMVDGTKVIVTDTEYYDIMEWAKLPNKQVFEYTITDEDTIVREYNGKELVYNIS